MPSPALARSPLTSVMKVHHQPLLVYFECLELIFGQASRGYPSCMLQCVSIPGASSRGQRRERVAAIDGASACL